VSLECLYPDPPEIESAVLQVNWKKGDDVIVHPSVTNEEAKTLFPDHTVHKVSITPDQQYIASSLMNLAIPENDAVQLHQPIEHLKET
jgi:hypothetical protein